MKINQFDDEPVLYCETCLSLKIRELEGRDFCDKCGSLDISSIDINEWAQKYTAVYGEEAVIKSNYLKEFMQ